MTVLFSESMLCLCVYMCMCVCLLSAEVGFGCLPRRHFSLGDMVPRWTWGLLFHLSRLARKSACSWSLCGCWGLKPDPHVCVACTLHTESPTQLFKAFSHVSHLVYEVICRNPARPSPTHLFQPVRPCLALLRIPDHLVWQAISLEEWNVHWHSL